MSMKYRKKPVVIETIQYTGLNVVEVGQFLAGADFEPGIKGFTINTLEGAMLASPGDWIIRGTHGEFYPIKAHIFEANYERAESDE